MLDVYVGPGSEPKPAAILLHGAGLNRQDYESFALRLAGRGVLVFNIDWAVLQVEIGVQDVACAVRFAGQRSPEWGGDPDRISLVAHSSAFAAAGAVATTVDLAVNDCIYDAAPELAGLVGISPFSVVGGEVWQRTVLGGNPGLRIRLIEGVDDTLVRAGTSERSVDILSKAGYDADVIFVDGGHFNIVLVDIDGTPPETDADQTLEAVLAVVQR
jgi:hypothetical protein